MCDIIGVDSLIYFLLDGLIELIGFEIKVLNGGLCVVYFDGYYLMLFYDYEEEYFRSLEEKISFYI